MTVELVALIMACGMAGCGTILILRRVWAWVAYSLTFGPGGSAVE